jgi:hypothetical protein
MERRHRSGREKGLARLEDMRPTGGVRELREVARGMRMTILKPVALAKRWLNIPHCDIDSIHRAAHKGDVARLGWLPLTPLPFSPPLLF